MKAYLFLTLALLAIGCSNSNENTNEGFTPVVFNENDFYWDENTEPYKEILLTQVNMMQYNKKICRDLEPGTLFMSDTKGSKDDPVFYVRCGKGAEMQNVFFTKSTAEENYRIHNDLNKK